MWSDYLVMIAIRLWPVWLIILGGIAMAIYERTEAEWAGKAKDLITLLYVGTPLLAAAALLVFILVWSAGHWLGAW